MALDINLHHPVRAVAMNFRSADGTTKATVQFEDAGGAKITIFMTPDAAHTVAAAFNSSMARVKA